MEQYYNRIEFKDTNNCINKKAFTFDKDELRKLMFMAHDFVSDAERYNQAIETYEHENEPDRYKEILHMVSNRAMALVSKLVSLNQQCLKDTGETFIIPVTKDEDKVNKQ